MRTCCGSTGGDGSTPPTVDSWIGLQKLCPRNPLEIVTLAKLGTTTGTYQNSATYHNPDGGAWGSSPVTLTGNPSCKANGTDDLQRVADADQWNFTHITSGLTFNPPPALEPLVFLRGGDEWTMEIPLDFGGSDVSAVQLSLRNNAATRGDAQGTVPVIAFSGTVSGAQTLTVTLKEPGQVCIGLYGEVGGQPTLFAMEWWIVP